MKTLFFTLGVLILLYACTPKAQLITLRGNNVVPATDGLVLNTDTLTLRYSFYSDRGLMTLTLYNKLPVPLYVDWKKSAFIVGKNKLDYWYDVANVNLSTNRYYHFWPTSVSTTEGTISKEDQVTFIPPKTQITKQTFVVMPGGQLPLQGQPTLKQEQPAYYGASPGKLVNIQAYSYLPNQSPLRFRNFLTLSTQRDFQKEFYLDTNFWAAEVAVMPSPQIEGDMGQHLHRSPDAFYVIMKTQ